MKSEKRIETLQSMLSEMKNAYYGGFRATQDEDELECVKGAIKKLEKISELYPELFLD